MLFVFPRKLFFQRGVGQSHGKEFFQSIIHNWSVAGSSWEFVEQMRMLMNMLHTSFKPGGKCFERFVSTSYHRSRRNDSIIMHSSEIDGLS